MDFQRRFAVRPMGDLSGPALIFSARKMLGLDRRLAGKLPGEVDSFALYESGRCVEGVACAERKETVSG